MPVRARREQDKDQRRIDILNVARELVFEKGLHAVTIKQIAQRAGLSVGAIYLYYKSKEDLYAALQVEALDLLSRYLRDACRGEASVENKIRVIAQATLQFRRDYKSYFDILDYFLSLPETIFPADIKARVDDHGNQVFTLIAEVVKEGIRQGMFKEVHPRIYAVIFWCSLFGTGKFRKLQSTILKDVDFDVLVEEMVEHFLDGLLSREGDGSEGADP